MVRKRTVNTSILRRSCSQSLITNDVRFLKNKKLKLHYILKAFFLDFTKITKMLIIFFFGGWGNIDYLGVYYLFNSE